MNPPSRKGRVLVVDDDPQVREMLRRWLVRSGREVVAASDVRPALERLAGDRFDLVITDLSMEQGSGLDVVRWLRERGNVVPVIMASGAWNVESEREARSLGCRILGKPLDLRGLLGWVDEMLAGRPV